MTHVEIQRVKRKLKFAKKCQTVYDRAWLILGGGIDFGLWIAIVGFAFVCLGMVRMIAN